PARRPSRRRPTSPPGSSALPVRPPERALHRTKPPPIAVLGSIGLLWFECPIGAPVASQLVRSAPHPGSEPRQVGGPERGGLLHARARDRHAQEVGLQLQEHVDRARATVHSE